MFLGPAAAARRETGRIRRMAGGVDTICAEQLAANRGSPHEISLTHPPVRAIQDPPDTAPSRPHNGSRLIQILAPFEERSSLYFLAGRNEETLVFLREDTKKHSS